MYLVAILPFFMMIIIKICEIDLKEDILRCGLVCKCKRHNKEIQKKARSQIIEARINEEIMMLESAPQIEVEDI